MTPTEIKTAVALYRGGLTTRGVAHIIGCAQSHAWHCLKRAGVEMRAGNGMNEKFAKRARNARIVADRRRGLSWGQIGRKHGISAPRVSRIVKRDAPELIGKRGW